MATQRAEIGSVLAQDVTVGAARERALLRTGVKLTERYRQALLVAGHNAIYIEDDLSADVIVTPLLREHTRTTAMASLSKAFATVPAAVNAGNRMPYKVVEELERVAQLIVGEISDSSHSAVALADLASADAYSLQHSLDVCALGLMIGKRLFEQTGRIDYRGQRVWDRLEEWLAKLGVGLLLHDVGSAALPAEVLEKQGELTEEEWAIVRSHPLVGVELLASDTISPLVKAVVRSHHERWDGLGYPQGLEGTTIPHFARIAAIADVFDAVTSERPHKAAQPQHAGCRVVNEGSGTQFDPEIVKIFNQVVAPYPPGDEITLADGRRGIVVTCPMHDLAQPTVRLAFAADGAAIDPEEIDLLERPELAPVAGEPVPA